MRRSALTSSSEASCPAVAKSAVAVSVFTHYTPRTLSLSARVEPVGGLPAPLVKVKLFGEIVHAITVGDLAPFGARVALFDNVADHVRRLVWRY